MVGPGGAAQLIREAGLGVGSEHKFCDVDYRYAVGVYLGQQLDDGLQFQVRSSCSIQCGVRVKFVVRRLRHYVEPIVVHCCLH